MTTVAEAAPIADPVVRRKLRRRPPPSIRNGRALLLGVAGYGLTGLFTIGLGVIIGVKGALGLFIPFALVTVPLAAVLYGITRLTRNRQIWSWAIAVGVGLLLAVISVYLIVTMQSRTSDANAIFFLQLLITPARSCSLWPRPGTSPGAAPGSTASANARCGPRSPGRGRSRRR